MRRRWHKERRDHFTTSTHISPSATNRARGEMRRCGGFEYTHPESAVSSLVEFHPFGRIHYLLDALPATNAPFLEPRMQRYQHVFPVISQSGCWLRQLRCPFRARRAPGHAVAQRGEV